MIFLISIVFIAEIIVATTLIIQILKFCDRISEVSALVDYKRNKLKWLLHDIQDCISTINSEFDERIETAKSSRVTLVFNILKGLAFSLIIAFLKTKYKRFMLIIQLLLILLNSSKEDCRA